MLIKSYVTTRTINLKNKKYTFLLKLVFGLALIFFIGWKIQSSEALGKLSSLSLTNNAILYFSLFIILIPINWGLETLKWRMLLSDSNQISFVKSFKLVLAGITTGIMTPNRLGNFVGRAYDKDIMDRENAIVATFLSNISQFMATILIGLVALYLLPQHLNSEVNKTLIYAIAGILQLLSFVVFIIPNNAFVNFFTGKFLPKYQKKIDELAELPLGKKLMIFLIAIFRYIVIVIQFYLVLKVFIEGLNTDIWVGIALTFLLTTLIPSVAFGKLFVREASAILILSLFFIPVEIILSCTFILWCFNLALPALLGMRFLYKK